MKNYVIQILTFFFLIVISSNNVVAEIKTDKSFSIDSLMRNTEIDLRINYGFFAHHHYEMKRYNAHFPMSELSLQKQTYGKSSWQAYFNYPTIGVTAFYSNFGNIDIMGKAYAIYPFINFPLNKNKVNTFGFRFGVGLGYLTEKYHHIYNCSNTSIGSNFNAAISLTFEYKRHIAERFKMSVFAGLTHFSNGCSNQPNSGINIINTGIGITYLLSEAQEYIPKKINTTDYLNEVVYEYYLGMSFGIKRIEYAQKENIGVYQMEFYIMDRVSNLSKFGIGLDLVYDATDNISIFNYYGNREFTFLEMLKPGIGLAYELMVGEVSFLFNFGYHPYGLDMSYGRWYQKLGLKVNVGEYLYAKIALNTHFGVADFIGFGLGIRVAR